MAWQGMNTELFSTTILSSSTTQSLEDSWMTSPPSGMITWSRWRKTIRIWRRSMIWLHNQGNLKKLSRCNRCSSSRKKQRAEDLDKVNRIRSKLLVHLRGEIMIILLDKEETSILGEEWCCLNQIGSTRRQSFGWLICTSSTIFLRTCLLYQCLMTLISLTISKYYSTCLNNSSNSNRKSLMTLWVITKKATI